MLYLLKGSRVAEYRRQNVEILGADEGAPFEVTYSRRWVRDGVVPKITDGAVIVFSDSPYERFVPIRFCVLEEVDDTGDKVRVAGKLGPFVRADGAGLLTERWASLEGEDRPGLKFLFEDDNPGLIGPRSPEEIDEAWRTAVDGLSTNGFFASTTVARVGRIEDDRGAAVDPSEPIEVGRALNAHLELRTPAEGAGPVELLLDSEPRGAAELVVPTQRLPGTGAAEVRLRILQPGPVRVRFGFKPEPLLSSRPVLVLTGAGPDGGSRAAPPTAVGARRTQIDVRMLLHRLGRDADLDDEAWMRLHEDVLLPADGDNPDLLGDYAEHAFAAGHHDKAVEALEKLSSRSPEQNGLLLLAALRSGRDVDVRALLESSDITGGLQFARFADALDAADDAMVQTVMSAVLDDVLADEKLIQLAKQVGARLSSIELLCRIADKIVYLDPEQGASLLLDRWPDPAAMPDRALELVLDWQVHPRRLTPYLAHRIEQAADRRQWDRVSDAADLIRKAASPRDQAPLLALAGRDLLASDDHAHQTRGFELLCQAVPRACDEGDIDLARDLLPTLKAHASRSGGSHAVDAVDQLVAMVDEAVAGSEDLQRWEAMRNATRADALRPHYQGRTLHFVGGYEADWVPELRADLALAEVRWHGTEKHGSNHSAWTSGLGDKDVVVIVTDVIGHAVSGPVKDVCNRRGVPCLHGGKRLGAVLDALEAGVAES